MINEDGTIAMMLRMIAYHLESLGVLTKYILSQTFLCIILRNRLIMKSKMRIISTVSSIKSQDLLGNPPTDKKYRNVK